MFRVEFMQANIIYVLCSMRLFLYDESFMAKSLNLTVRVCVCVCEAWFIFDLHE